MIRIDTKSASLAVDKAGSTPGVGTNDSRRLVILHLTRNAEPIISRAPVTGDEYDPDQDIAGKLSAIKIEGHVDVYLDSRDNIASWEFHFIQLARTITHQGIYVGRTASDGLFQFDLAKPPARPARFAMQWCLDSGKLRMPFLNPKRPLISDKMIRTGPRMGQTISGVKQVITNMNDHPTSAFPYQFGEWFLFEATVTFEAVTVFVARDRNHIVPLAHVGWGAVWDVTLKWRGGKPQPSLRTGKFDHSKVVMGPPTDPIQAAKVIEAAKITDPNADDSETSNALFLRAQNQLELFLKQGQGQGMPSSWFTAPHWRPPYVPSDFFQ